MTVNKITSPVSPLEEIDKINEIIDEKQDTLVSGTNIKTINNNSILGSGDLTVDGLPSQTGHTSAALTTNGTTATWTDMQEVHVVIETYSNGASWYRVYDDGWCEQGGQTAEGTSIVVNLLKAYINTNYNVQITCVNKSQSDQNWTCSAKTTNSFTYSNSESYAVDWRACGYIA